MGPLVGIPITSREHATQPGRHVFALNRPYVRALVEAGAVPILLPAFGAADPSPSLLDTLDGLLLPGGGDIHPGHYQEPEHELLSLVDPDADALELGLARWAVEGDLPTLGICRGQQVLNVALGGSLLQDIPSQLDGCLDHQRLDQPRQFLAHSVRIAPESRLAAILGRTEFEANSLHHQAVKMVGRGLRAVGWSPDGVIEAIEDPTRRFLVAVQFHPEELWPEHSPSRALFEAFVAACAKERVRDAEKESERGDV